MFGARNRIPANGLLMLVIPDQNLLIDEARPKQWTYEESNQLVTQREALPLPYHELMA